MNTIQNRCRSCQLQLCKSREEPPHADLVAVAVDNLTPMRSMQGGDKAYTCQKCGTSLINSEDRGEIGWRRAAA